MQSTGADALREHLEAEDYVWSTAEQRRYRTNLPRDGVPRDRAIRRAARRRARQALRQRRLVVRRCQGKSMYPQARCVPTALQVVLNGQPVQGSRSFAAPKKVVHTGGTEDPIRGFCNPYSIGFSAILRSVDENPFVSFIGDHQPLRLVLNGTSPGGVDILNAPQMIPQRPVAPAVNRHGTRALEQTAIIDCGEQPESALIWGPNRR